MRNTIYPLVILLISTYCLSAQTNQIKAFDQYVEANREKFEVPGCALTIVKDGKVIFSKAYGIRGFSDREEADTETIFGMMSTTKATTAVAMAFLVDEGKVNWDDKVIDHLPEFQLSDPYITSQLKVRDLFTHNAGLGNADFLWAYNDLSKKEILDQMRLAPMAYSFRGGFIYQNIMYLVAGQLIEKLSGMTWERFMTERLFQPLGMENTFPTIATSAQYQNRSRSHFRINEDIIEIEEMSADLIGPAGSAWSTADDVGKWVQFMLDSAKVDGKAMLSAETYGEILKPHAIIPKEQFYPTAQLTKPHWMTYGLGWFQQDYRGDFLNFHTGSLAGRTAIVGLVPDKDFGFYFFGNLDHAELRHALMLKAIDVFVHEDDSRDWATEIYELYHSNPPMMSDYIANMEKSRAKNTKTTHSDLKSYAGTYRDPYYGTITIKEKDGALHLRQSSQLSAKIEHWHYDVFSCQFPSLSFAPPQLLSFELNPLDNKVKGLDFDGTYFKKED